MVFFVIGVLILLILIVFRKYKSVYSVIITTVCITGITTAVLLWGLAILSGQPAINFFYNAIGKSEFYHLLTAWYGMDILCTITIIRRYQEYKKINSNSRKDGLLS
jgi:hypothetical protein